MNCFQSSDYYRFLIQHIQYSNKTFLYQYSYQISQEYPASSNDYFYKHNLVGHFQIPSNVQFWINTCSLTDFNNQPFFYEISLTVFICTNLFVVYELNLVNQ
jgi:hypothetical protein